MSMDKERRNPGMASLHRPKIRKGTRRMKLLDSNEIRQLRDVCVFEVNGIEVYM